MPAGYDLAIHGLLRKRSELMRELEIKRDDLAAVQNDIGAVERTLDVLGYTGELDQARPRVLKDIRRELRRFIIDELRKSSPQTTRDLSFKLAAIEGKNPEDKKAIKDIVARVSKGLSTLVDKGVVARLKTQGIKLCRYRLADLAPQTTDRKV